MLDLCKNNPYEVFTDNLGEAVYPALFLDWLGTKMTVYAALFGDSYIIWYSFFMLTTYRWTFPFSAPIIVSN